MRIYIFIVTAIIFISCSGNGHKNIDGKSYAHIKFKDKEYKFGNIEYKSEATYSFKFKNTSDIPLILENVKSSCGCTVPKWPTDPIPPGEESSIDVKYNTRISGSFSKTITVYSNADNSPATLRISGHVARKAPEEETK